MDDYNYVKQFISNKLEDQPIPSIYNDVKKDCLDKLKLFEQEFTQKCVELKTETMNKLFSGELEYQIEPHNYVESYPIVHLKTKIIIDNLSKNEIKELHLNINILQLKNSNINIYLNYPDTTLISLHDTEYVIFFLLRKESHYNIQYTHMLYITNYGRFIKSSIYQPNHDYNNSNYDGRCSIVDDICENIVTYQLSYNTSIQSTKKISQQVYYKPLEYKMPRLFLKILEAYEYLNTELLQECCKDYFIKYMESKKKDDKIKECEIIINKQKEEIEKLKKEIHELKKFYINS
jgi:hypothetical protein